MEAKNGSYVLNNSRSDAECSALQEEENMLGKLA